MILSRLTSYQDQAELSGMNPRRLFGMYYTPVEIATVLVEWALAGNSGPILDPSFGNAVFLETAVKILSNRQVKNAPQRVFGVEIDPGCFESVRRSKHLIDSNCIQGDFLTVIPKNFPSGLCSAVVGNPPYVRHHWIRGQQQESVKALERNSTSSIPATAGLWVYFLLHSMNFLARGGRFAMLVPEAILQADYAMSLRHTLAQRFGRILLIYVRDRMFVGTDEAVVVVACSRFGEKGEVFEIGVESIEELISILENSEAAQPQLTYRLPTSSNTMGTRAATLLESLLSVREVNRLGDIAEIRVGVVTGANRHFIRSTEELETLGVPRSVRHRVVPRTRWLTGLEFTEEEHDRFLRAGAAGLLVRPKGPEDDRLVEPWIHEGLRAGIEARHKCSVRKEWFRLDLPSPSDGFATCARTGSPLLILNRGQCHNSNAIHSLNWKRKLTVKPEAIVVGFLTSVVSVWAELQGRRYGGGVLKLEPGTLQRVPVPIIPGSEEVFAELDALVRQGKEEQARVLADNTVLKDGLGLSEEDIDILKLTRLELMKWRQPSRGGVGFG